MTDPPDGDRVFIQRSVRVGIVVAASLAVVLSLLWLLKSALTPLVAAFVVAYLLDPVIDWFENHRVPRPIGIVVLIAALGVVIFGVAFVVVPRLASDVALLTQRMPGYLDTALVSVGPRLSQWFGISLPQTLQEALDGLRESLKSIPLASLRGVAQGLLSSVTGTLGAIVAMLVVPVIAYYTLVEFDRINTWFLELVPPRFRDRVHDRGSEINAMISGFVRGQLIVCAILGLLYAIGFAVIGIEGSTAIGVVAGLLAIIPYVGSAAALAAASILCVLQYGLDGHLALVVGWYALVQTLEGFVLTPRIVGQSVGLHPVAVIVSLLIGGDLLGFLGLLVAVPLAAVVQVFVHDAIEAYRGSSLYADDTVPSKSET